MKKTRENEVLIVNKELVSKCKNLSIAMDNCECFTIPTEYILDISCEAVKDFRMFKNQPLNYSTQDGFILISSEAKNLFSSSYEEDKETFPPNDFVPDNYKLVNRLSDYNDVVSFALIDENGAETEIFIPYDPAIEVITGSEIEYSGCASFEVLADGNMELRFGKSSHNPEIPRNNYHEVIENWTDFFGDFRPSVLSFDFRWISADFNTDGDREIAIACVIDNKEVKNQVVTIVFDECESVELFTWCAGKFADMYLTKLIDGRIYVGLGDVCSIVCNRCYLQETEL